LNRLTAEGGLSRNSGAGGGEEIIHLQRLVVEQCPLSVIITDSKARIIYVNPAFVERSGYSVDEVLGRNPKFLKSGKTDPAIYAEMWATITRGLPWRGEFKNRKKNGEHYWDYGSISPVMNAKGEITHYVALQEDVTTQKEAERELRLHSRAVEQSPTSVVITDSEGIIVYVNPTFTAITGYTFDEVIGQSPSMLKSGQTDEDVYHDLWNVIRSGKTWRGALMNKKKNGELFWEATSISAVTDPDGTITHYVAVKEDVTEHKKAEATIQYLAHHDDLTGLANRALFQSRLHDAIAQAKRTGKPFALLVIDLDHFKNVNDTLGHPVGDQLLKRAADELKRCVRETDTVARLGGDEFAVVATNLTGTADAATIADTIIRAFSRPFVVGGTEVHTGTSIGISIFPSDDESPDKLLGHADMALYHAKSLGRMNFQFFSQEMNLEIHRRRTLEVELRRAIEAGDLHLHFQPKLHCDNLDVIGVEALCRWVHPDHGAIPPDEFISVAENSGLILPLGEQVLRQACTQWRDWQSAGLPPIPIAVNLSAVQLKHLDFMTLVMRIIDETGIEPSQLELEITESMVIDNIEAAVEILRRLQENQVRLSMDDFGTGYSSLSYLKRLPIHSIKIDKSFVQDVTNDADSKFISKAIVMLGQSLNLTVVAEGVETDEQFEYFRSLGCDAMQGYFVCPPLPADQFAAWYGERFQVPQRVFA
jgi:diguanylate cyclase (GGDEF)-like protein/PAS domain S-box-containing protein